MLSAGEAPAQLPVVNFWPAAVRHAQERVSYGNTNAK